jgi:hypothetical protein
MEAIPAFPVVLIGTETENPAMWCSTTPDDIVQRSAANHWSALFRFHGQA